MLADEQPFRTTSDASGARSAKEQPMSSQEIYLAARACARAERFRDQAIPLYWRGKPNFIDQQRIDFAARAGAKAAARAAERPEPRR
jgi:hypothetical protein